MSDQPHIAFGSEEAWRDEMFLRAGRVAIRMKIIRDYLRLEDDHMLPLSMRHAREEFEAACAGLAGLLEAKMARIAAKKVANDQAPTLAERSAA